jgi:hypothetical protein
MLAGKESLLDRIAAAATRLVSSKRLRAYERLVVDAWRASLRPDARVLLDKQLEAVRFVQRQAGDAKVVFYYDSKANTPEFRNLNPDLHVATVVLRPADGGKGQFLKVKIFLHRGRFFSLEFPKRPSRYLHLHNVKMETLHIDRVDEVVSLQ